MQVRQEGIYIRYLAAVPGSHKTIPTALIWQAIKYAKDRRLILNLSREIHSYCFEHLENEFLPILK